MLPPIPITDEQAKLGQAVVEEGGRLGRYLAKILGTAPEDLVGLAFGDPLRHMRTITAMRYEDEVARIHARRGVKETAAVSPSVAMPLLAAACDETRPELRKLWAELLAAATDPARSEQVRLSFIETVKSMDPPDVAVLALRYSMNTPLSDDNVYDHIRWKLNWSEDKVEVSIEHLSKLGCCKSEKSLGRFYLSAYGRELMRACSDA